MDHERTTFNSTTFGRVISKNTCVYLCHMYCNMINLDVVVRCRVGVIAAGNAGNAGNAGFSFLVSLTMFSLLLFSSSPPLLLLQVQHKLVLLKVGDVNYYSDLV